MRKLPLSLLLLPSGAFAQLTFQPYVTGGYIQDKPQIKNSRVTRDYEGLPSYEGAPRLIYLADISDVSGFGMYAGGGFELGLKKFPLSLKVEVAGEHLAMSYTTDVQEKRRTEYDFEVSTRNHNDGIQYFRCTPSLVYRQATKCGVTLTAQGGVSMMAEGPTAFRSSAEYASTYAAINGGVGVGYGGVMFNLQANFGTANLFGQREGFNIYSRRINAGFSIYPKEFAQMFK